MLSTSAPSSSAAPAIAEEQEEEEKEKEKQNEEIAPRTWMGEYNAVVGERRFLVFSSSGGFNNQRAILEYALWIARYLNRTLVIPMAGKHTQMWYKHEQLLPQHLFPMDRILDFEMMQRINGSSFTVLNVSVPLFIKSLEAKGIDIHTVFHYKSKQWTANDLVPFRDISTKFLYFRGGEMYHRWGFPDREMEYIQRHVRYSKAIRKLALDLVAPFNGPFNAVHIRLGDYTGRTPSGVSFLNKMVNGYGFNTTLPVYIATEPTTSLSFFRPILEKFPKVFFSKDLPRDPITKFKSIFPPGQIRNDMLGILEQLLCVAAKRFVPTDFSTFSAWIRFMRHYREDAFPESIAMREGWNV